MHESERHRIILSAVQDRPVVTVIDLCNAVEVNMGLVTARIGT